MTRTQTIQTIYEAFGRADVPAILDRLTDDVDWNNERVASRECPWNGNFAGKGNVPGFFGAVDGALDIRIFDPHTFIEQGDRVAVLLHIESTVRKNGRPVRNDAVHVWTFDGDKVSGYRHYNDTAAELEAWRA